jgi:hypothetical protein
MLQSPAWADLRADLAEWRSKQIANLMTKKMDSQDFGNIQGVINFIDIISNLTI